MIVKLTQTQANTLRIFKQCLDRAFARHTAKLRKRTLAGMELPTPHAVALDTLFASIAAMPRKPRDFGALKQGQSDLLYRLMQIAYTSAESRIAIEQAVLSDIYDHAAEYELLAQMPPPRRERTRREPQSLVERRAARVDSKVVEWERKLKVAKGKLKKYRRKQKYYLTKKGAVN